MKQRLYHSIVIVLFLALFAILVDRADSFSFLHDEAFTFLHYVDAPLRNLIYLEPLTANNHILNSLFSRITSSLFGPSELALRLPSLLAFPCFVLLTVLLGRKLNSSFARHGLPLFLIANPFALDFFALSRGYSWALTFELLALWAFVQKSSIQQRLLLCSACILAALSNFSFLYFAGPLLGLAGMRQIIVFPGRLPQKLVACWIEMLSGILLLALTLPHLLKLRAQNLLYYGGTTGFVEDTIFSLVAGSIYGIPVQVTSVATLLAIALLGAILVQIANTSRPSGKYFHYLGSLLPDLLANALYSLRGFLPSAKKYCPSFLVEMFTDRRTRTQDSTALWLLMLLISIVGVNLFLHHFFEVRFLVDRTALLFLPLFWACFFYGIDPALPKRGLANSVALASCCILLALPLCRFLQSSQTYLWPCQSQIKQALDQIGVDVSTRKRSRTTLGISSEFVPIVEYYQRRGDLPWLKEFSHLLYNRTYRNYLVLPKDRSTLSDALDTYRKYPACKILWLK